ncbi:unnamed protein product [Protopolystoma xenopodis]|uniref:Uncharacterized protein n=1 Tax=Protopolystoma xenopodis TaxID=117903 RepID=A0A3S5ADS2_9PLAT|nr:unnamed protein product [Protopolystoma xenopodis]
MIELSDLAKRFEWHTIKTQCWDSALVPGRSLYGFGVPLEVTNFPMLQRSHDELCKLAAVKARRMLQKFVSTQRDQLEESLASPKRIKAREIQSLCFKHCKFIILRN